MGAGMTSNNAANFGFGVATRVLTSNGSGTAPTFQPPATGIPPSIGYKSGYYYQLPFGGTVATNVMVLAADTIVILPFYISKTQSFDSVTFNVTTGGVNLRCGIYNMDGFATTLIVDLGVVDVSGTGVKTLGISQSLNAGWYGFATQASNNVVISGVATALPKIAFLPIGTAHGTTSIGSLSYVGTYAGGLIDLSALTPTLQTTQQLISMRAA